MGQLIDAANVQSEIESRFFNNQLTLENIKDAQVFRQPRLMHLYAQTQVEINRADAEKASAESTRALLQPRINQINSEIQRNAALTGIEKQRLAIQAREADAQIRAADAREKRSTQEYQQAAELFPSQKREAEQRAKGYVELRNLPGLKPEETPTVPTGQLLDYLSQSAGRAESLRRYTGSMTEKEADDRRKEIEMSREAEKKLLTLKHKPGVAKSTGGIPKEFESDYQTFHQYSDEPYIYVERGPSGWGQYLPGMLGGEFPRFEQYKIPPINGVQYSARDIWEAAKKEHVDIPTFMEQFIYPKAGVPVPWPVKPKQ